MPHQILHLLGMLSFCVFDIGVDDAQLSFLLERMEVIVQHKQDAAQHPNIHSIIDWIFEVQVDHLWRTVHQCGVLFESLLIVIHLCFRNLGKVDSLAAATAQIAQFSCSFFCQKNIFYFYVLMKNAQFMHFLQTQYGIFQYFQYLSLSESFLLFVILCNQIINCFLGQLHQNIALKVFVSLYLIGSMITDYMWTRRKLLHDLDLIFVALFGLLILADQLFEGEMTFGICFLDQQHIAVPSLGYLMQLFESFAVDVEPSSNSEPSLYQLQACSHYYQQLNYTCFSFRNTSFLTFLIKNL